jgi:hypothetical protein
MKFAVGSSRGISGGGRAEDEEFGSRTKRRSNKFYQD